MTEPEHPATLFATKCLLGIRVFCCSIGCVDRVDLPRERPHSSGGDLTADPPLDNTPSLQPLQVTPKPSVCIERDCDAGIVAVSSAWDAD